ncbi:MAG: hypothetical protein NC452_02170 [Eubacterium sp.]|nr:hypothetical protein [Eubacterium sp.]
MKLKNISEKVICIGLTAVLPDKAVTVTKEQAELPSIKAMIKQGLVSVEKDTPAAGKAQEAAETPKPLRKFLRRPTQTKRRGGIVMFSDLTPEGKRYFAELAKLEVQVGYWRGEKTYDNGTDLVDVAACTAVQSLVKLGTFGKALVQQEIIDGGFEPNAPATVSKKGSAQPLIDTGTMRQSVGFKIKKRT